MQSVSAFMKSLFLGLEQKYRRCICLEHGQLRFDPWSPKPAKSYSSVQSQEVFLEHHWLCPKRQKSLQAFSIHGAGPWLSSLIESLTQKCLHFHQYCYAKTSLEKLKLSLLCFSHIMLKAVTYT